MLLYTTTFPSTIYSPLSHPIPASTVPLCSSPFYTSKMVLPDEFNAYIYSQVQINGLLCC